MNEIDEPENIQVILPKKIKPKNDGFNLIK